MAACNNKKLVIVGLFLAIAIVGSEPSMANGQAILCGMSGNGLRACRPSVSGQKPQVPPTPACCSALSDADLQCLCHFGSSGLLSVYKIDPQQAMALPAECKIEDPSWHC